MINADDAWERSESRSRAEAKCSELQKRVAKLEAKETERRINAREGLREIRMALCAFAVGPEHDEAKREVIRVYCRATGVPLPKWGPA